MKFIKPIILPVLSILLVSAAVFSRSDEPTRVRSSALGEVPQAFARFAKILGHMKTGRTAKMNARIKVSRVPDRRAQEALVADLEPVTSPEMAVTTFAQEVEATSELAPALMDFQKAVKNTLGRQGIKVFKKELENMKVLVFADGPMGEVLMLYLNDHA